MKGKLNHWIQVWGILAAASTVIIACTGTTRTTIGDDPQRYTGPPIDKIMVIGVSDKIDDRRLFETTFADCLKAQGVMARSSLALMAGEPTLTRERVKQIAGQHDLEAVLVTRLVGVDEKTERYRSGFRKRGRASVHRNFGDYDTMVKQDNQSGYHIQRKIVRLEPNLYEVASEALIRTVLSDSMDTESIETLTRSVCNKIVRDMQSEGILR
jgi:hypothetical protein